MYDSPSVYWDWLVGVYLFLGGLSGGAYVTGAVADYLRYRGSKTNPMETTGISAKTYDAVVSSAPGDKTDGYAMTALAGMVVSFVAIGIGGLVLLAHLGEPLNVVEIWLFANPESWMSIGVWVIILFVVMTLLQIVFMGFGENGGFGVYLGPIDRLVNRISPSTGTRLSMHIVGVALAVTLIVYTALLLSAVQPVVPLWHSTLLPLLFLTSGLSIGISATLIVTALSRGVTDTGVHEFSLADDVLIVGELAVLGALLVYLSNEGGIATQSYEILTETFVLEFWVMVVAVGLVAPLALSATLVVLNRTGHHLSGRLGQAAYTTKFGLVLVGGLFLRLSVLYAALHIPLLA